jgi:hypothetical protein
VAALGGGDDLHDGEGSTWRTGEPSRVGACSMPSVVTEHCREERTDTLGYDSLGSVMFPLPRLVTTTEDILGGGEGAWRWSTGVRKPWVFAARLLVARGGDCCLGAGCWPQPFVGARPPAAPGGCSE